MRSSILFYSFWCLCLRVGVARAYWRMACGVSQTSRTDPILSPGTVSGHVHKFAGGNNVNPSSTHDSLLASTCSSCEIQEDKSAYWTPQLYYSHSNGTVEEVQNDGMTVYYVGFRMITGNSLLRSYDSQSLTYQDTRPIADRVSFRCINEANDIPEQHYMSDTNCVNGMRAQVNFQSCWDGQNLFLPNSQHVAYLSGIDYGQCPPTHPIPIPGLFFEVLYWTNRVDQSAGGQFVFANGDATGYGFHGDFLNGWNQDVQTAAVRDCLYTDDGGVISACPVLAASDDVNFSRTCPESPSVWDEPVRGSLSGIPGCNPITSGPGEAPQVVCPLNSNTPTQSEAASLATITETASATTFSPAGILATASSTDTTTSTFDALSDTSTVTATSPDIGLAQSTPGIFATVATNNTADSSTPTLFPIANATTPTSPLVSFTTVFVVANPTAVDENLLAATTELLSTSTFTPTTSFITDLAGACSFFSAFSIAGCPPPASTETWPLSTPEAFAAAPTTLLTVTQPFAQFVPSTFTTFTTVIPTTTTATESTTATAGIFRPRSRFRRRQETPAETEETDETETETNEQPAHDLSRIIAEVVETTGATDSAAGQEKEEQDTIRDDDDDNDDDEDEDTAPEEAEQQDDDDEDSGDRTYHGSGMGCFLWGSCS